MYSQQHPSPHGVIQRYIEVKNDFIGFHAYKDAPDEVAFLKNRHRHRFYVRSIMTVKHDDRELEFFMVQDFIATKVIPYLPHNDLGSCEMIAEFILWGLVNQYDDDRFYSVTVSEDQENEGCVEYSPDNIL
jgi:hypothetical protein